jgi:hypothetical protein
VAAPPALTVMPEGWREQGEQTRTRDWPLLLCQPLCQPLAFFAVFCPHRADMVDGEGPLIIRLFLQTATWRSGYAAVCKTVYPGSIPGVASIQNIKDLVRRRARLCCIENKSNAGTRWGLKFTDERGVSMTVCPICKSQADELDRTGDATGFKCPRHGRFKVASSVFATKQDAAQEQWERALQKAKAIAPDAWAACIQTYDF